MRNVLVAFSGGTDSAFLLSIALETLPKDNVRAITANSCFLPQKELDDSIRFCKNRDCPHLIIDVDVLGIPGVADNPPNRCYLCKKAIFKEFSKISKSYNAILVDGSNADDASDYRPGRKALEELAVRSPLAEAGLEKYEIREVSRIMGLSTAGKPSSACLASRFPYGRRLTLEDLQNTSRAEEFLMGTVPTAKQVRVRVHQGNLARIEVENGCFAEILQKRHEIVAKFKDLGFDYITLDLQGYRMGSMNEALKRG